MRQLYILSNGIGDVGIYRNLAAAKDVVGGDWVERYMLWEYRPGPMGDYRIRKTYVRSSGLDNIEMIARREGNLDRINAIIGGGEFYPDLKIYVTYESTPQFNLYYSINYKLVEAKIQRGGWVKKDGIWFYGAFFIKEFSVNLDYATPAQLVCAAALAGDGIARDIVAEAAGL